MKKPNGIFERDFENGSWVKFTNDENDDCIGIILGFDASDGEYWVSWIELTSDPQGDTPWGCDWIEHKLPKDCDPPREGFGTPRDHVFLVGTRSRTANVEAYADVETLVADYPNERDHALQSVADPDELIGDAIAVRFAIVKGTD